MCVALYCIATFLYLFIFLFIPSSAMTLLVGDRKDIRPVNSWMWFVSGDDLTGALYTSYSSSCHQHFYHP